MKVIEQVAVFIPRKKKQSDLLEEDFSKIKDKRWTPDTVLKELAVQLGQLMSILHCDEVNEEEGRKFNDIADECCDILLQLNYLITSLNIDASSFANKEEYQKFSSSDLTSLFQLYGQINEAYLEENGERFSKPRTGFANKLDFVADRIIKMHLIIFNYCAENGIDINKKYDEMCQEASHFATAKAAKITKPTTIDKGQRLVRKNMVKGLAASGFVGLF